jgi:hypothetical protein
MSLAYFLIVRFDHGMHLTLREGPLRHDIIVRVATTGWPYDAEHP